MTDGLFFIIVLCIYYLADSIFLIRKNSVLFIEKKTISGQYIFYTSGIIFKNKFSLFMVNIFPPFRNIFVVNGEEISLGLQGVAADTARTMQILPSYKKRKNFILYENIENIRVDENFLYINGYLFAELFNHTKAVQYKDFIFLLKKESNIHLREKMITEFVKKRFNIQEIKTIHNLITKNSFFIKLISSLYFIFIFIFLSVILSFVAFEKVFFQIISVMFLFALLNVIFIDKFVRKTSINYKDLSIIFFIKSLFLPAFSIRVFYHLTAYIFEDYSPVAVAAAIGGKRYSDFLSFCIRDLTYPVKYLSRSEVYSEIVLWYNKIELEESKKLLKNELNLDFDEILLPQKQESGDLFFCPRCLSGFVVKKNTCPDCQGVILHSTSK